MRHRPFLTHAGVLALCCASLGLWSSSSAVASCVAQQLQIDSAAVLATPTGTSPPPVSKTQMVSVSGEWFRDGCDDTGGGAGCSGPSVSSTESPLRGVALVLRQGASSWTLGTADAAGLDERYAIHWRVRLPAEAETGRAVIGTDSAEVTVEITG